MTAAGLTLTARGVVYGRLLSRPDGETRYSIVSSELRIGRWSQSELEAAISELLADGALRLDGDKLFANEDWL